MAEKSDSDTAVTKLGKPSTARRGKKVEASGLNGSDGEASVASTSAADVADTTRTPEQAQPGNKQAPQLTPEMRGRIAALRGKVQLSIGQVVLAMMNLPRYRHQTLVDLTHIVLDPLLHDRVAIAHTRGDGASVADDQNVAGIAIWATVSEAADAKITEQVKAGVFPVRLAKEDWVSGEIVWLLDVVASDRAQATRVCLNFKQLSGSSTIKLHPVAAGLIDNEIRKKMRAQSRAVA